MRKIVHRNHAHNARLLPAAACALLLAALLGACGGERDTAASDTAAEAPAAAAAVPDTCPVRLNDAGWTAFRVLGDRIVAGAEVTRDELVAFGGMPVIAQWRATMASPQPSADRVANWIESTFWDQLGDGRPQKASRDRWAMKANMEFGYGNRDAIDAKLAAFAAEGRACAIAALARRWTRPDSLPASIEIRVQPALTELRYDAGVIYVDAGMFLAARNEQFVRHIGALLYRNHGAPPGPPPHGEQGAEALLQTMRALMAEGVAQWIENPADLYFGADHPTLSGVNIVPEELFTKAQEVIDLLDTRLPAPLADASLMDDMGPALANTMVARNGYIGTGFAMASVIAARLGEDRLAAAAHSVPGFFAAYQEAALRNASPPPVPGALGVELYECVPPLSPATYEALHARLVERFGP